MHMLIAHNTEMQTIDDSSEDSVRALSIKVGSIIHGGGQVTDAESRPVREQNVAKADAPQCLCLSPSRWCQSGTWSYAPYFSATGLPRRHEALRASAGFEVCVRRDWQHFATIRQHCPSRPVLVYVPLPCIPGLSFPSPLGIPLSLPSVRELSTISVQERLSSRAWFFGLTRSLHTYRTPRDLDADLAARVLAQIADVRMAQILAIVR